MPHVCYFRPHASLATYRQVDLVVFERGLGIVLDRAWLGKKSANILGSGILALGVRG